MKCMQCLVLSFVDVLIYDFVLRSCDEPSLSYFKDKTTKANCFYRFFLEASRVFPCFF